MSSISLTTKTMFDTKCHASNPLQDGRTYQLSERLDSQANVATWGTGGQMEKSTGLQVCATPVGSVWQLWCPWSKNFGLWLNPFITSFAFPLKYINRDLTNMHIYI